MISAIIQARMGSSRLPGKILLPLAGKPLLAQLIERTQRADSVDEIVVASTTSPKDDAVATYLQRFFPDVRLFRGSEEDVLDRFYQAAAASRPEVIVRLTADDPLKAPELIDEMVGWFQQDHSLDYCCNNQPPSFPEGLDLEAFRFTALRRAHTEAKLPSERQHVTPYFYKHPELFKLHNTVSKVDRSAWRLTVDYAADYRLLSKIFSQLSPQGEFISLEALYAFLDQNPDLKALNSGTLRNEGYLKSLQEEQA